MTSPIVNPEVPYVGEIPGGLIPGKMCRIQGVTHPEADRFSINLATGPNSKPRDDTSLHISVRLNQGYIARNSYKDGSWGDEQGSGKLPIGQAQSWEILILVDQNDYKLAVNGQHFCEFPFRIPLSEISHILIDGDVTITLISWEGITGVGGGESASKAAELNAEGPQGIPPQMGGPQGGYGPPPGAYGPPPGYGPPGPGYGPPPPGYGVPPPPGAHEESGFSDFLEQAQSVLAGAIRTGAAEKILGSLLGGGGEQRHQGYAPQNAKYGMYPDLPPDLNVDPKDPRNQNAHKPGPVESLLTNFLSGGNRQPQQTPNPSIPNQTTQGPDLVSLLSGLLSNKQQTNAGQQENTQSAQHNPQQTRTQGSDITSMLAGLLSGGNQQNQQPSTTNQYIPGSEISQNQHSAGVDLNSIISNLLSGGQGKQQPPNAPPPTGYTPTQTQSQSQGLDLSGLLSSLLGPQPHSQPGGDSSLPQGGANNQPQQTGSGVNLNSLLSSLLAGGGGQHPGGTQGPTPQPPESGGYKPNPESGGYKPQGGFTPQPPPTTGGPSTPTQNQQSSSDPSKPASTQPYEDVSDQLEQLIAREGKGGQQRGGDQSQVSRFYFRMKGNNFIKRIIENHMERRFLL
nr:unnamed protein product [Callosobruchus analis]